ncbi:MAG: contractile injection system protein, VgrG/Pvc8 family [Myxococcota bacterium]
MNPQREAWIRVWLDGEPWVEAPQRLLSAVVEERADGATWFKLKLDLAPIDGDWDLLADPRFALLRRVTLAFSLGPVEQGEAGSETVVVDGYVTSVEARFGPQRVPDSHLELEGYDAACLMHLDDRVRAWTDRSDAAIVRTILAEYGFGADVDETAPSRAADRGTLLQRGTDAEFLRLLARRNGFELWMERAPGAVSAGAHPGAAFVGHFHKPRLGDPPQPPLRLMPREEPSLLEFCARWESHHPTTTQSWHLDERTRRVQTTRAKLSPYHKLGARSRADLLTARLAEVLPQRPNLTPLGLPFADVPHDQHELGTLAAAELQESDWLLSATGTVQTLRYPVVLRARRPVAVEGAGKALDGTWYVRSVRHTWTADAHTRRYDAEVELVRNAMGAA